MTKRSLSWPVLIGTVLAAPLIAVLLYYAHANQVGRTASALLARAQAEREQGNWPGAIDYFDRYLRLSPKDSVVRGELASASAQGAETWEQKTRAVELHYRALGAGVPGREQELREKLAELLVETGRFPEAESESRKLLEINSDSPLANRTLALAIWQQYLNGSLATADLKQIRLVNLLDKAIKLNPADVTLASALAFLYRDHPKLVAAEFPDKSLEQRLQAAEECLARMVRDNPQNANAYLSRYYYHLSSNSTQAKADLAQAVKLAPDAPAVLQAAAYAAITEARSLLADEKTKSLAPAKYSLAQDYIQKLASNHPKKMTPELQLELGATWMELGDRVKAVACWSEGLKQFPQPTMQVRFNSRLVEDALEQNQLAEARELLDAMDLTLNSLGGSVSADQKLAILRSVKMQQAHWHLRSGQPMDAMPLLRQVMDMQPKGDANFDIAARAAVQLGGMQGAMGDWSEAAASYDRAAQLQPRLAFARVAAANAWLQAGRPEEAIDRAEKALTLGPSPEARFLLTAALLRLQLSQSVSQRNWTDFKTSLDLLERDAPSETDLKAPWQVDFLKFEYAYQRGKTDGDSAAPLEETIGILRNAEKKYSKSEEFLIQLALTYEQMNQAMGAQNPTAPNLSAEADRVLEKLRQASSSPATTMVVAARLAMLRKDYEKAKNELKPPDKALSAADLDRLEAERLNIAVNQPDWDLAKSLLVQQHQRQPKNLSVLRRLAEIDLDRRDLKALETWEKPLAALGSPGEFFACYYRAWRLFLNANPADEESLRSALAEQAKLAAMRPNWAESYSLLGFMKMKQGQREQAAAALEKAVQLGEGRVIVFEQLIGLLNSLDRSADAERYLARFESQLSRSQGLTELASSQMLRHEQPEQAISLARKGIAQRPRDLNARLWLARLLVDAKKTGEAEKEFLAATKLAPNDSRSWNGLFSFYLRNGEKQQAQTTLERFAATAQLKDSQRSLNLAQGYELLGDIATANRHYQAAADKDPSDATIPIRQAGLLVRGDPLAAEKHLRRALEIDPQSPPARRMLASLLVARGGDAECREAEALLTKADDASAIGLDDTRVRASLLAKQGGVEKIGQAILLLERIILHPSCSPSDRLLMSQLLETQSKTTANPEVSAAKLEAARQQLVVLAAKSTPEPNHLAALVDFLLRNESTEQAATWLDKYEDVLTGSKKDHPDAIAQYLALRMRQGAKFDFEPWLLRLEKVDSNPLRVLALRSGALAEQGKSAEVGALVEPEAKKLLKAANTDAEKNQICHTVGDIYFKAKDYSAAERWFRELTSRNPASFDLVAATLARRGMVGDVIPLCQAAGKAQKTSQPAIVLANTLVEFSNQVKDFRPAAPILQAALEAHPNDTRLLYSAGVFQLVAGHPDEAVQLFRHLVKMDPRNIAALNNLALILAERPADRQEASLLIDKALAVIGDEAGLLDTKGAILMYGGQPELALKYLESAARGAKADSRHCFHLAVAYQRLGKTALAKEQLQKALDRQLESQILTPTDRRLLAEIKPALLN